MLSNWQEDLTFDYYRAGNKINQSDNCVRVTHIPTMMVVSCETRKFKNMNKIIAIKELWSLAEFQRWYRKQSITPRPGMGVCECILEPAGRAGLEGYNIRDRYSFQQSPKNPKLTRLYHDAPAAFEEDRDFEYYECCAKGNFKKYFKVLIKQKERGAV